jgi:response regulator RpfG family c-di-GMP phosphodiesterase
MIEAAAGNTDISLSRLAALESKFSPTETAFRDFIEVELLASQRAGRVGFAQYYNKKYLSSLAEFQRKSAIEQFAAVKRLLKKAERRETTFPRNTSPDTLSAVSQHMEALASLAELREDATGEHAYRVGQLSRALACAIGYSSTRAELIERAARLHDIGKLATPDAILLKRGKLSPAEQEIVRRHPHEGSQMLADLLYTVEATEIRESSKIGDALRVAAEIAQYHHEWWDGSGYPLGLAGASIPEAARIVALADVFDELTHMRPYKPKHSRGESIRQIEMFSGRQFEPRLCRAFIDVLGSFEDIAQPSDAEISPFIAANRVIKRIASAAL